MLSNEGGVKLRNFRFTLILMIVSLIIVIVACSSDDINESSSKSSSENNVDSINASGELNIAYHLTLPQLDPHTTTDLGVRDVSHHIYETLLVVDGNMEIQPMLAESYEQTDDGKEIIFKLREGINFHNGKELKAEDVVASMNRWVKMSTQAKTYLQGVTFEEKDDYTVVANVPDPTLMTIATLSGHDQFPAIMPKEVVEEVGEDLIQEVIGTGPYKLEDFRTDQYVHLTKFDDYQARSEPSSGLAGEKKAFIKDIYYHIVPDVSTRIAGLQTGEYDAATSIPHDNVQQLQNMDNIDIQITNTPWDDIVLNKKGIFKDLKMRQAINAAIDKEALLFAAYGNDDYFKINHSLVPDEQTDWLTDVGKEVYETYDLELAKKLLEESNYNGEEITLLSSQERKYLYDMSVVLQEQLKSIGMNIKLENTDWATFISDLGDENAWDMYVGTLGFNPVLTQALFWNPEWYGWHDSDEMNAAVEKVLASNTIENAAQYTDELHKSFYNYLPVIKIGDGSQLIATNSEYDGFIYHFTIGVFWNMEEK